MDAFIENGIDVDFVVGVSAGIANAGSYVSKQKGRCFELGMKYLPDKRYMGMRYFFKKGNGSYFNRDFVFNRIPNELLPFDYEAFDNWHGEIYAVLTNLDTGETEYVPLESTDKEWKVVQASCALPFIFKPIEINGKRYFDGGCTDALPVKFAFEKGCDKVIAILTREESYKKESETDAKLSAFFYRKYKNFAKSMKIRSKVYNDSRADLYKKQKEGKAFIFAPKSTEGWKRIEKATDTIQKMYEEGYRDGMDRLEELKTFIEK